MIKSALSWCWRLSLLYSLSNILLGCNSVPSQPEAKVVNGKMDQAHEKALMEFCGQHGIDTHNGKVYFIRESFCVSCTNKMREYNRTHPESFVLVLPEGSEVPDLSGISKIVRASEIELGEYGLTKFYSFGVAMKDEHVVELFSLN